MDAPETAPGARHALFACIPAEGHVRPLLAQARALARRGWRVSFATFDELAPTLAREGGAGVRFVSAGALRSTAEERDAVAAETTAEPDFLKGLVRSFGAFTQELWGPLYDVVVREAARARPDVLVADFATPAALDAAETARVPCIVNNPDVLAMLPPGLLPPAPHVPLPFTGQSIREVTPLRRALHRAAQPLFVGASRVADALTFGRALDAQRRARGVTPRSHEQQLRGRVILVDSAFGLEYERALPREVHMVGPMIDREHEPPLPPEWSAWLAEGPPVVYASLGTIALPSAERLAALAEGLRSDATRVLWALRPAAQARLPARLPPNVRVEAWVPSQTAILAHPNVRAFVSHCGVNSVHESIAGDTPIVGIPMVADQLDMAVRVVDAGVGLRLDKQAFTPGELRAAIARVMDEERFRAPLAALRARFRAAGGVERAADLIAQVAAGA